MPEDFQPPDPRVTTPLLTLVTQQSLDEDYRTAATRRIMAGGTPGRGGKHAVAAVAIAIFGILLATAAAQTSLNAEVDAASRRTLLERIDQRSTQVSAQQEQVSELEAQIARLGDLYRDLGADVSVAEVEVRELRTGSGLGPVTGPGARFTFTDAPGETVPERVRPSDMWLLLNGLWGAGAEAVAINGQRVASRSSIAPSGEAIQIDGSPLAPPYIVEAIGNPRTLLADFYTTVSGDRFQQLADVFGFDLTVKNVDADSPPLRLPAAPQRQVALRYAEPIGRAGEESAEEGSQE